MRADVISVGHPLPRIVAAFSLEGRKVNVVWESGMTKVVDLAPALASRRVYIPLHEDDELFRTLRVSEYGTGIEWNDELDFSALWMGRLSEADFTNA